jgi:hypothetical protein
MEDMGLALSADQVYDMKLPLTAEQTRTEALKKMLLASSSKKTPVRMR